MPPDPLRSIDCHAADTPAFVRRAAAERGVGSIAASADLADVERPWIVRPLVADGYPHIDGRLKERINKGGEKVSPRQIDGALLALEGMDRKR